MEKDAVRIMEGEEKGQIISLYRKKLQQLEGGQKK